MTTLNHVKKGAGRRPRGAALAGLALVEALLSSLLLSAGMVLLLRSQASLREHGDFARERAAAAVLAEAQVERLRARLPGRHATAGHADADGRKRAGATLDDEWTEALDSSRYAIRQRLEASDTGLTQDLDLQLRWQDRFGQWQGLRWPARLSTADPVLALQALNPHAAGGVSRVRGRHAAIPDSARELAPGWLAFQPDPGLSVAWLLNAGTGRVEGLCELGTRSVDDLRPTDLADCRSRMAAGGALLLSGLIRFDLSDAPDPGAPRSIALAAGLQLLLSEAAASPAPPHCASNASRAVARGLAVVSYHCLVLPRSRDLRWTGRSELTGSAADLRRYRVCRYSADHDHDGRIGNPEHPARYTDVDGPLTQQNFLVIRAGLPCPSGLPADPAAGRLLDTGTFSHQPPE